MSVNQHSPEEATGMAKAKLTEKQTEVYGLMQQDMDPKDMGIRLGVSKAAVYGHIRAIREAGQAIPIKYASVGVGGRGQARSGNAPKGGRRGTGRSAGKGAPTGTRGRNAAVAAVVPPTPTVAPTPAPGVNVDDVFSHLRDQIGRDRQNIETRRQEIATSIETLNGQVASLQDEDGGLEVALARLAATEQAIAADSPAASENGTGSATAVAPTVV